MIFLNIATVLGFADQSSVDKWDNLIAINVLQMQVNKRQGKQLKSVFVKDMFWPSNELFDRIW